MIPLRAHPRLAPNCSSSASVTALHWRAIVKAGLRYETGCSSWGPDRHRETAELHLETLPIYDRRERRGKPQFSSEGIVADRQVGPADSAFRQFSTDGVSSAGPPRSSTAMVKRAGRLPAAA